MPYSETLLGGLTADAFLREYWQKKPLLIRGAIPDFASPLAPDELAGLACEEGVETRLILEKDGAHPWQLRYGPFGEADFAALPPTHWTLLVQEVDRLVPEVAALLDRFRFIPTWRIDDVMVSYAPEHGGVGAHVDNYDVFLLQGLGHRRWQIGREPVVDEALVPDLDVSILQHFEPDDDWVLAPGDMLYLPPRLPHYGVALDDCMTYSIGFRAPSHAELATGYLGHVMEMLDPARRYHDPDLTPPSHPGEIREDALQKVRAILRDFVRDDAEIDRWFGHYITEPRRGHYALPVEGDVAPGVVRDVLREGGRLRHGPGTRFAFIEGRAEGSDAAALLFVNGETYALDAALAYAPPLLCDTRTLQRAALAEHLEDPNLLQLLADLVSDGYLELERS